MELLNGEIFGAVQALGELYDKEWPIKDSLALIELMQSLDTAFSKIERIRGELVRKYLPSPRRASIGPEDAGWEEFSEDYNTLMMETTNVEFVEVVLPKAINGIPITIKPNIMRALTRFVRFEGD